MGKQAFRIHLRDNMKKLPGRICFFCAAVFFIGCDKNSTGDEFGISMENGMTASSTSLVLLTGGEGKSVIAGGTEPYSVSENANASVITASMSSRELHITALAEGSASVKVKDSSTPAKTIAVSITVKNSYTANVPGSLSFTSNRGDYSVNGIAVYGNTPPASGQGVIAVQNFESLFLLAYKVNSPASIDITLISFESNTANYSGTFLYPGAGKRVNISYFPDSHPNDSSFLEIVYLLASSATATVDTITPAAMRGTFSGRGYFLNYGTLVTNQTIVVNNGIFNVPIVRAGTMEEAMLDTNLRRAVNKILYRKRVF